MFNPVRTWSPPSIGALWLACFASSLASNPGCMLAYPIFIYTPRVRPSLPLEQFLACWLEWWELLNLFLNTYPVSANSAAETELLVPSGGANRFFGLLYMVVPLLAWCAGWALCWSLLFKWAVLIAVILAELDPLVLLGLYTALELAANATPREATAWIS